MAEESDRVRLPLDFSSNSFTRLQQIKNRGRHASNADTIREALQVYEFLLDITEDRTKRLQLIVVDRLFEIEGFLKPA